MNKQLIFLLLASCAVNASITAYEDDEPVQSILAMHQDKLVHTTNQHGKKCQLCTEVENCKKCKKFARKQEKKASQEAGRQQDIHAQEERQQKRQEREGQRRIAAKKQEQEKQQQRAAKQHRQALLEKEQEKQRSEKQAQAMHDKEAKQRAHQEHKKQLRKKRAERYEMLMRCYLDRKLKKLEEQEINQIMHERKVAEHKLQLAQRNEVYADRQKRAEEKKAQRKALVDEWRLKNAQEFHEQLAAGRYADLYKQPRWQSAAYWSEDKDLFSIAFSYQDTKKAYMPSGTTDLRALIFGDKPITVGDILLPAKLLKQGKVNGFGQNPDKQVVVATTTPAAGSVSLRVEDAMSYVPGASRLLACNAQQERMQIDLQLMRYLLTNNLACGVKLPIVEAKNTLSCALISQDNVSDLGIAQQDLVDGTFDDMFMTILQAKGMTGAGGREFGCGDLEVFVHYSIDSARWDKMQLGMRCVFPTGKLARHDRLWSPDLGNGGFIRLHAFWSTLLSYNRFVNPYLSVDAGLAFSNNVWRRVPRKIASAFAPGTGAAALAAVSLGKVINTVTPDKMAFGDRIEYKAEGTSIIYFEDFDTTVRGFADQMSQVSITPGAQASIRIGNLIEHVLAYRGFLDLFYDFQVKGNDEVSGLDERVYNLQILREDTACFAHKIGFDYSYQFDLMTRLHAGVEYTFAGRNTPRECILSIALNHAF